MVSVQNFISKIILFKCWKYDDEEEHYIRNIINPCPRGLNQVNPLSMLNHALLSIGDRGSVLKIKSEWKLFVCLWLIFLEKQSESHDGIEYTDNTICVTPHVWYHRCDIWYTMPADKCSEFFHFHHHLAHWTSSVTLQHCLYQKISSEYSCASKVTFLSTNLTGAQWRSWKLGSELR